MFVFWLKVRDNISRRLVGPHELPPPSSVFDDRLFLFQETPGQLSTNVFQKALEHHGNGLPQGSIIVSVRNHTIVTPSLHVRYCFAIVHDGSSFFWGGWWWRVCVVLGEGWEVQNKGEPTSEETKTCDVQTSSLQPPIPQGASSEDDSVYGNFDFKDIMVGTNQKNAIMGRATKTPRCTSSYWDLEVFSRLTCELCIQPNKSRFHPETCSRNSDEPLPLWWLQFRLTVWHPISRNASNGLVVTRSGVHAWDVHWVTNLGPQNSDH